MKKTSLALIAAISMLGSVAHADDAGKASGGNAGGAAGGITAGAIGAGAVVTGVLVASNSSDGNPVTSTGTNTTTGTGN
ncbi:hypothetical protein K0H59_07285 [Shewanella sp. FJAT-51649]|uniref:hypothetical protein n=1 Tax=Shewanella sp. FJAT-51649 TaxID=2864210 RepID=UPI001C65DC7B|nr:hypothetical protein [Shewanella sp. FJAT-51649]QYJ72820.1 hypothetical protein K0H59_07285 [Shewanella sp. FJAT-51649]